jgi:hypothetical protein
MRTLELYSTRALAAVLAFSLCGIPEQALAQSAQQSQNQQPGMVNPSQPPLQPLPSTSSEPPSQSLPAAPAAQQPGAQQPGSAPQQNNAQQQTPQEPAGTAAAEGTPTAGGLASKPAGNAIAPAKQKQTRSLLIKVGAIAAGAVAAGTIYGLTKASPTRPPGTSAPTSTARTR